MSKENVVVVLEESVITTEKNRKLLSSEFVVYLKVETPLQLKRWQEGRIPLLPIADLKAFLDKQHQERDRLYEAVAKLTVDLTSLEEDVNKVIKAIGY